MFLGKQPILGWFLADVRNHQFFDYFLSSS